MQKYQDFIIAAGIAVSGASVLVRPTGGTSTSVIYSDGTTTKANPTVTGTDGKFSFYAANGRYDLVYSGGIPAIASGTLTDVMLEDVPLSNLSELTTASAARSSLGLGSAAVVSTSSFLQKANDLSDLSTASNARNNLGLGAAAVSSTSSFLQAVNNLSELSTSTLPQTARANIGAASSTSSQTISGGQRNAVVALASTGQITPDFSAGNNFSLAMTVNTTLAKGTNAQPGQSGFIAITQNSTAKTLAYDNTFYKFAGGSTATLSTATVVGTLDVLRYNVMTSTSAECEMRNGLA